MEQQNQNTQSAPNANQNPLTGKGHKNTGMAVVAYIIFFIPLLTEAKNDPFVKYHVKQGLVLFLCGVVLWLIVNIMPIFLGIYPIISLALLVLAIMGIINAVNGVEKPLPLVGSLADNFKF